MKLTRLISFSILCLSFISCELEEEQEKSKVVKEAPKEILKYKTIELYKDEPLANGITVPNLRIGDKIIVEIKGTYKQAQFSKIYVTESKSTWKKCVKPFGRKCLWIPQEGKCRSRYRDRKSIKEETALFELDKPVSNFVFKSGEIERYLPSNASRKSNLFRSVIKVTPDLFNESDELTIIYNPSKRIKNTKVGFLGFEKCDGELQAEFNPNTSQKTFDVNSSKKYEYLTNVTIKYLE